MATSQNLEELSEQCPLSLMKDLSDDEASFVVLPKFEDGEYSMIEEIKQASSINGRMENVDITSTASISNSTISEDGILKIIHEHTLLKERLLLNNKVMSSQYEVLLDLQEQLHKEKDDESIIKMLKKENQDLRDEILQLKNGNQEFQDEILQLRRSRTEKEEQIVELRDTVTRLNKVIIDYAKKLDSTEKELNMVKKDLTQEKLNEESIRQTIQSLQSQLVSANQKLSDEDEIREKLNEARNQLKEMENSKITADEINTDLKTQLEMSKELLEAEKVSNMSIKTENNKLLEEVKNLEACCKELQEQIDMLWQNENRSNPLYLQSTSSSEATIKCPICSFEDTSEQVMQNHVDRCIKSTS